MGLTKLKNSCFFFCKDTNFLANHNLKIYHLEHL